MMRLLAVHLYEDTAKIVCEKQNIFFEIHMQFSPRIYFQELVKDFLCHAVKSHVALDVLWSNLHQFSQVAI